MMVAWFDDDQAAQLWGLLEKHLALIEAQGRTMAYLEGIVTTLIASSAAGEDDPDAAFMRLFVPMKLTGALAAREGDELQKQIIDRVLDNARNKLGLMRNAVIVDGNDVAGS